MAAHSSLVESLSHSPSHSHKAETNKLLQPLLFPEKQKDKAYFYDQKSDTPIPCLLCNHEFNDDKDDDSTEELQQSNAPKCNSLQSARQKFLHHLVTEHKLVINCITKTNHISDIASFKCYARYWKERFSSEDVGALLPVILTNPETKGDSPEKFYLLSDVQSEDKQLRQFLQMKRLEALLDLQQLERSDTCFKHRCIFCHETISGKRELLFEHLFHAHQFNIGQPDNIVMVHKFLDVLQSKLENLQCLYCERTFRDHVTLRDHMRKKLHKRINPSNKAYDKFYIINYLEFGKSWEDIKKEKDQQIEDDEDEEPNEDITQVNWNIWTDSSSSLTCLFCTHVSTALSTLNTHMREVHHFDFVSITQELDYYSKVKIINYIRRQVYNRTCIHCNNSYTDVLDHMTTDDHFLLPEKSTLWDQSQYLFPTYENDGLLCAIDDEKS